MSHEIRAELLKVTNPHPCGVRELVKKLHRSTRTVVSLIKEMEEQGLIEINVEKRNTRGRPRYLIKPTSLGEDYLATYNNLELKPLRSRRNDLVRAIRDAEYAMRLESRGLSPFQLFLELNSLVTTNNRGTM